MIPSEKVETRRIDGRNVVLLPYTKNLVPIYHGWMQDPELLHLTESEPLTLEEEYANQVSWGVDPTKYCFIVHSRRPVISSFRTGKGVQTALGIDYTIENEEEAEELKKPVDIPWVEDEDEKEEEAHPGDAGILDSPSPNAAASSTDVTAAATSAPASSDASSTAASSDTISSSTSSSTPAPISKNPLDKYPLTPIGDVNLFLYPDFNLEDSGISGGGCEIECMVAEKAYRRRGLGLEAIRLIMAFSIEHLGVERFVVKILGTNQGSIKLFEEKLKFKKIEYVECFDEFVLFKDTSNDPDWAFVHESEGGSQFSAGASADATSSATTSQAAEDASHIAELALNRSVEEGLKHLNTSGNRVNDSVTGSRSNTSDGLD